MLVLGAAIFLAFLGRSVDSVFQPRDAILSMACGPSRAAILVLLCAAGDEAAGVSLCTQCVTRRTNRPVVPFEHLEADYAAQRRPMELRRSREEPELATCNTLAR
jgi:hypothetical protein